MDPDHLAEVYAEHGMVLTDEIRDLLRREAYIDGQTLHRLMDDHDVLPGILLNRAAFDQERDRNLFLRFAARADLPDEMFVPFRVDPEEWPSDPDVEVRTALHSSHLPIGRVLELAAIEPPLVGRAKTMLHPDLPREEASVGIDSPDWHIRVSVAYRSDLTRDMIRRLVTDPMPVVRMAIAKRPVLPPGILDRLVDDPNEDVRNTVAMEQRLSEAQVIRLVPHDDVAARNGLAALADLDPELARGLVATGSPAVLGGLAQHPATPADVLTSILDRAESWPLVPRDPSALEWVVEDVAVHPTTSATDLERLAMSPLSTARKRVAARRDIPSVVADLLAEDSPDEDVRDALRSNPHVPVHVRARLEDTG